ncbi:MAG: hypothetical protein PG981_001517 [Wolbachia endosymbiont of Ctenocephalides orientis wCori]|nr:MAG: hypothetical protein PG981_001517 [Wolbachia endosymbiont of Ctenocephalides orientis wCori]
MAWPCDWSYDFGSNFKIIKKQKACDLSFCFIALQGISIVALLYVHLIAYVVYFCMLVFGFAAGGHILNFTVGS